MKYKSYMYLIGQRNHYRSPFGSSSFQDSNLCFLSLSWRVWLAFFCFSMQVLAKSVWSGPLPGTSAELVSSLFWTSSAGPKAAWLHKNQKFLWARSLSKVPRPWKGAALCGSLVELMAHSGPSWGADVAYVIRKHMIWCLSPAAQVTKYIIVRFESCCGASWRVVGELESSFFVCLGFALAQWRTPLSFAERGLQHVCMILAPDILLATGPYDSLRALATRRICRCLLGLGRH